MSYHHCVPPFLQAVGNPPPDPVLRLPCPVAVSPQVSYNMRTAISTVLAAVPVRHTSVPRIMVQKMQLEPAGAEISRREVRHRVRASRTSSPSSPDRSAPATISGPVRCQALPSTDLDRVRH